MGYLSDPTIDGYTSGTIAKKSTYKIYPNLNDRSWNIYCIRIRVIADCLDAEGESVYTYEYENKEWDNPDNPIHIGSILTDNYLNFTPGVSNYQFVRFQLSYITDYGERYTDEVSISVYTPATLSAPTNIRASNNSTTINVSWTASSYSAPGTTATLTYSARIWNSSTDYSSSYAAGTSASMSGATWGTIYNIQVTARLVTGYETKTATSSTITFTMPSAFGKPGTPVITQNGYSLTVTWTAASSNVGTPSYYLAWGSEYDEGVEVGTGLSITLSLSSTYSSLIGTNLPYMVRAHTSDWAYTANSDSVTKYVGQPSITAPVLTIGGSSSSYTGGTLPLSWTASTKSYITDNISYDLYIGGVLKASNITSPVEYIKGDTTVIDITTLSNASIVIRARVQSFTKNSNTVTYTYQEPYHTLKYHNGSGWVKCKVWHHDGSGWILCNPHYHNGSGWVSCSGS